jgi:RimJ/RimL family protein N-acetyltransferase
MQSNQIRVVIDNIGSCICTMYHNGKANVMIIDSVFVEEKYRGKGFGTKILKSALKLAKKEKIDSIELVVNKDNKVAKNLYEKLHFEKTKKDYYRLIIHKL